VDWTDLRPFEVAMKPGFERDVRDFAQANRYAITASLTIGTDATVRGVEHVRFTNRSSDTLTDVVFRLYPNTTVLNGRMTVADVRIGDEAAAPVFSQHDSVMTIPLSVPLRSGSAVDIAMTFAVTMTRDVDVSYGRFGFRHGVVSATAWYPTLSVYEPLTGWWTAEPSPEGDPAFTETGLYDVRLTTPANVAVAMSGTEVETRVNDDGTVMHHDVTGPMRDHAFLASARYGHQSSMVDGIRVNVWYYADASDPSRNAAPDVARYAGDALRAFQAAFGPYPFDEFDVVENPTPTGVEYPGLVQIAEREWRPGDAELERTVAHETGHQWFYSLVGNDQVNHPWLDEGLTTYAEIVYGRAVHPDRAAAEVDALERRYAAYVRDGSRNLPIDLPVARYDALAYGMIVYLKPAVFLLHLERELGASTVARVLREYVHTYRYAVARPADLESVLARVAGRDIRTEFCVWVGCRE
jgi:aminopeptidase N